MNARQLVSSLKAKGFTYAFLDSPNAGITVIRDKDMPFFCLETLLDLKILDQDDVNRMKKWLENPSSGRCKEGLYLLLVGYGLAWADFETGGGPGIEKLSPSCFHGSPADSWSIEVYKRS